MAADGAPHHDTDRRSDLAVMDANEYKQKRRLERILDAMDAIPDQADHAKEQYVRGEIDMHARRVMVQDAVKDAIWEAWNLLMDHEKKRQRDARKADEQVRADGGAAAVDSGGGDTDEKAEQPAVWPHSEYFVYDPNRGPLGEIPQTNDDDIVVKGLYDFFHTDEMWIESWSERVKERNMAPETIDHEVHHSVPRKVSWKAALRLKEFLNAEHDLEIKFESLDDRRPYDDWREEFENGVYDGPDSIDLPHRNVQG